jgi:hypothetical protein
VYQHREWASAPLNFPRGPERGATIPGRHVAGFYCSGGPGNFLLGAPLWCPAMLSLAVCGFYVWRLSLVPAPGRCAGVRVRPEGDAAPHNFCL